MATSLLQPKCTVPRVTGLTIVCCVCQASFHSTSMCVVPIHHYSVLLFYSRRWLRVCEGELMYSKPEDVEVSPHIFPTNYWQKYNPYSQIWTLVIPFERSLSKLSENHKIVEIGSTEFKLWQLKQSPNHWLNGGGVQHLSTAITLVPLIQCQKILGFSDSLERDLSNDVFQSNISLGP